MFSVNALLKLRGCSIRTEPNRFVVFVGERRYSYDDDRLMTKQIRFEKTIAPLIAGEYRELVSFTTFIAGGRSMKEICEYLECQPAEVMEAYKMKLDDLSGIHRITYEEFLEQDGQSHYDLAIEGVPEGAVKLLERTCRGGIMREGVFYTGSGVDFLDLVADILACKVVDDMDSLQKEIVAPEKVKDDMPVISEDPVEYLKQNWNRSIEGWSKEQKDYLIKTGIEPPLTITELAAINKYLLDLEECEASLYCAKIQEYLVGLGKRCTPRGAAAVVYRSRGQYLRTFTADSFNLKFVGNRAR